MGRERQSYIQQTSCSPCRHCNWGFWTLVTIVGGLYLLGKRQRPDQREQSVEAIDEPEVTEAWMRVSNWPQFRVMRDYIIRRMVKGRSQLRVLDIGSGAGQLLTAIAKQSEVKEAVGIDLSDEMVKLARSSAEDKGIDAQFLQVDAAEMPFPDASFDLVLSTISLHHWEHPQQVLQEINRVLAPGGRVLIFDLRRNASPIFWGVATLVTHYIVPAPVRNYNEPLASFKASYTPWEAVLLACKAGWDNPRVTQGPIWMAIELEKAA